MPRASKPPLIRFTIQAKIILPFLFLAVGLIFIISYLDFFFSRSELEQRILSDLTAIARSKAAGIRDMIREDFEDARDLAGRIVLREALQEFGRGGGGLESWRSRMLASINITKESSQTILDVDICDRNGIIVSCSDPQHVGADRSKDDFFLKGVSGVYLGDPYFDQGAFVYDISAPVFSFGGNKAELLGVARAKIDASRLLHLLTDYAGLGRTGETVLGRQRGADMVFLGPLRHRQGAGLGLRVPIGSNRAVPLRYALEKKSGLVIGPDYRGAEVLAAYDYIPVPAWGLVVKIDRQEAFEPVKRLFLELVLIGCLLILVSILVIIDVSRYISRPLKQLQAGTRELARGNLDYRVDVTTTDEAGELADSFNIMARDLQAITVSRDRLNAEIEERREAEKKLHQALRARSDFTSMVSHELRTPLAAIKEGIGIVHDGVLGPITAEQKEFLGRTNENVDRLARIINDILDFQKLDAGKMALELRQEDAGAVVREACATMSPLVKQKGLDFHVNATPGLFKAVFDRDRITQVLINLVSNAVKFTDKGSIAVDVSRDGDLLHVAVKDSGKGIRHEDMPRLFKSFEQLERPRDRKGGTGLGLAISKEIIELHRGTIWAESEFGRGSTFHFTLPLPARS